MGDAKRWTVTYTKHMKQKRKVYQDGALELHGSCEKILLYDDCGKLLDSRFLKKDEVIETGGTLTFDTHLVDIGELEGICKPLRDLNFQRRDEKPTEKTGTQRQKENKMSELPKNGTSHNHSVGIKKIVTGNKKTGLQNSATPRNQPNDVHTSREWHALYTTQITRKAKRYHDGTLRLSLCGSHQRQVMLYEDCGKLLASRFLKKDEVVESGVELAFDTHLVDIGDPGENSKPQIVLNVQGDKQSIRKIGTIGQEVGHNSSVENKAAKLPSNGSPSNILKGNLQSHDPSVRVSGSYTSRSIVDGFSSNGRAPRNELLRDASQILSILKKPVANESLHSVSLEMEQTCISLSSDLLQSCDQVKGQKASGVERSKVDAEHKCGIQNFSRENTAQLGSSRTNFSQPKETQEVPSLSFTNLIDPEHEEKLQPDKFFTSSMSFPSMAASNISKPNLDMELTDKVIIDLTTTMEGSLVPEVIGCNSPENNQIHCTKSETLSSNINIGVTSGAPLCSSEYKQVYESSALAHSESDQQCNGALWNLLEESNSAHDRTMLPGPESSSNDVWVLEIVNEEKPKQILVDNVEPDAQKCEDAFLFCSSCLGGPPGCAVANAERESTEEFKSLSEKIKHMDDFPSFDWEFRHG